MLNYIIYGFNAEAAAASSSSSVRKKKLVTSHVAKTA